MAAGTTMTQCQDLHTEVAWRDRRGDVRWGGRGPAYRGGAVSQGSRAWRCGVAWRACKACLHGVARRQDLRCLNGSRVAARPVTCTPSVSERGWHLRARRLRVDEAGMKGGGLVLMSSRVCASCLYIRGAGVRRVEGGPKTEGAKGGAPKE